MDKLLSAADRTRSWIRRKLRRVDLPRVIIGALVSQAVYMIAALVAARWASAELSRVETVWLFVAVYLALALATVPLALAWRWVFPAPQANPQKPLLAPKVETKNQSATEKARATRERFLNQRRQMEEDADTTEGMSVVLNLDNQEPKKEVKISGFADDVKLFFSKESGTGAWFYCESENVKAISHDKFGVKGELIDVRALRAQKGSAPMKIGERIFITDNDDRVLQIKLVGVLYYNAGDDKNEVRFRYQLHEPGQFLIRAM